jgi:hypothetical protein
MMNYRARWKVTILLLLAALVVWRSGVFWTLFFAPGLAVLDLMAFLPTHVAAGITYGIDAEGGAGSAIPLVGVVSIVFWAGLMLASWAYRRHKRATSSLPG